MRGRLCADCGVETVPVRVVVNVLWNGWSTDMAYVPAEARHAFASSQYAESEPVAAFGCPECGQIRLFAEGRVRRQRA